ncbi:putative membrane protein (TIGR02226 family) [Leeuwenhoekiella aestuarii]|uniref:Putative membrane protein (TIGR02226 family) n=1 Tax=Leeuwenhoekiella aestuarii TaxID=2249426 RepID=A0A4Q0NWW1_9FLAO|nr:BatA domain-containing protein [Leeuwenhoekiella aestuarii]RXG15936.1 putative membrane protein (TIGR02226 family) [Leeuwenhoekiella aestuarii]RXG16630.1 putative membrane protein (TIGR02226 family) [Leeuwenhoekiella aestuarii]
MFFANPLYLWALLGLAVPVAIHLWSKSEGKTIQVGSISIFQESETTQSNSLHLNEWILLLLRMLAVALLVFILAEPFAKAQTKKQDLVYLVEPGLLELQSFKLVLDSLAEKEEVKLLQKGFSAYNPEDTLIDTNTINYWQLVQDLQELQADHIVVYSQSLAKSLKGKRPEIPENINWITIDSTAVVDEVLQLRQFQDSVEVLSVHSTSDKLYFTKEFVASKNAQDLNKGIGLIATDTLSISFSATDSLTSQIPFLKAGFEALNSYLNQPIVFKQIENPSEIEADVLIWLQPNNPPEVDGITLLFNPDAFATHLIEPVDAKNYVLTQLITRKHAVTNHLPEQLLPLLNLHPKLAIEIYKYDNRVASSEGIQPLKIDEDNQLDKASMIPFAPWFWLALVLVLIVERMVSRIRKQ